MKKALLFSIFFVTLFCFSIIQVNATTIYDSIVYITDNSNYANNLYSIVANTDFVLNDIDLYYIPNNNSLYLIEYCYNNSLYMGVEDSCFIFECSNDFDLRPYNANNYVEFDTFSYYLEEMFSELKDNGNDVIFICNTDQDRYSTDLGFLNYVDFHIDTDVFYLFMINLIDEIEANYSSLPIENYTFLINKGLYDYTSSIYFEESYVFQNYFKPYLQYNFNLNFSDDYEYLDYSLDNPINVSFYYNTIGSEYRLAYRYNNHSNDLLIDISDNDFPINDCCYLGMSYTSNSLSSAYLYQTINDRNNYDSGKPIFYYNFYSGAMANYSNETALFYANGPDLSSPTISTMLVDFINGANLIQYDNWYGMANITHKMVNMSNNGWMNHCSGKAYLSLNYLISI